MIKFLFLLLSVLTITGALKAQNPVLDSFRVYVSRAKGDSDRLCRRLFYAQHLARLDFDKAVREMEDIKKQSIQKSLRRVYALSVFMEAGIYYDRGDYINNITQNELAERLFLALPPNVERSRDLATIYNDMGASYSLINDIPNAQKYYTLSNQLMEEVKDYRNLVFNYFNTAFLYIDMQEWQKALDYFKRALLYKESPNDKDIVIETYSRAAAMCFRLKKIEAGKGLLDSCKRYLPLSKLPLSLNYYHNARGEYYYAINSGREALVEFRLAYNYGLEWKDPYYYVDDAWEIGRTFLLLNKADSAEKYLQIALDTAKKYRYLPKTRFILNDWCSYYDRIGNYRKAYTLRTDLLYFTDTLVNLQNHNQILLFDARFNSQKRETQILRLEKDKGTQELAIKQKNMLNYILIGIAIMLIIFLFLFYRNYVQKQKLQSLRISELEAQQQLTATEAVLKGEEQERVRLAKDLHDGLGGMLSGIKYSLNGVKQNMIMTFDNAQAFERSIDMLDSSIKEMRRVAHNMMPEALVKFGLDTALKDFCNDIERSGALKMNYQSRGMADVKIDQTTAITLYRIVQELINNSIKHAAAASGIVQAIYSDGVLSVTVEDDGKGFNIADLQVATGIGWRNIQNRVEFIKGRMDINSQPGKGTSVLIQLDL